MPIRRREPLYNDFATVLQLHGNCNHPPLPMSFGEAFLKNVYDALTSNPGKWSRTVMIVCYDEHGGFFDVFGGGADAHSAAYRPGHVASAAGASGQGRIGAPHGPRAHVSGSACALETVTSGGELRKKDGRQSTVKTHVHAGRRLDGDVDD
jgi:hypothetical protein